jgi:tRNA nucleotidyltransferase/poly(A) polymerase
MDFVNPSPREIAADIVARLQAAGFAAFWVGGCVRKHLKSWRKNKT